MKYPRGFAAPTVVRLFLLLGLLVAPLAAGPWQFTSGETRVHLLELYSSEGCSSCPPAESWLGGLREEPGLWRDFVPVAFHVTYWDRLGWRDRFARPEFTARQYAYASRWRSDTVYTPGFVLDGAEWRAAFGRNAPAGSKEKAGLLSVDYATGGACRVEFRANGDYEVHAAVLGGGMTSPVRAGENSGRTLRHEFVVLVLAGAPLQNGVAELTLPQPAVAGVSRLALAVWVTRRGEPVPVQAAGGWLD